MGEHDAALFASDSSTGRASASPPKRTRHELHAGQIYELVFDGTIVGSLEIRRNKGGKYGLWSVHPAAELRLRLAEET